MAKYKSSGFSALPKPDINLLICARLQQHKLIKTIDFFAATIPKAVSRLNF